MINPFKKTYTLKEQSLFVILAKLPLFSQLNYKQMSLFLPHMHERVYHQDEVVFFRNDPSHALYILKKGEVTLNIDINEKFEVVSTVKEVSAFGESSLLPDTKRQLNAFVTSETAGFYVIPQDNIFTIFDAHLNIKAKMLGSLAMIYNEYHANLFKSYKSAMGFFNLSQLYRR